MRPIKTRECNVVYGGDKADIIDVPAERVNSEYPGRSFDGANEIRIYWEPSDGERQRIANGSNFRIHMLHGVSPHWIEVVDSSEVL